jgi:YidC/Oxa1 family membrane protein insertase
MNNRFLLYVAFSLVLFMIWQQWNIEQNPQLQPKDQIEKQQQSSQAEGDIPEEALLEKSKTNNFDQKELVLNNENNGENLTINNPDIEVTISTLGGTIKKTKLLNYYKTSEKNSENINLFNYEGEYYVAQSGLLHDKSSNKNEKTGLAPNHHDLYEILSKTSDSVTLKWLAKDKDISVIKKIKLNNVGFNVEVTSQVINNSSKAWAGRQYRQIRRESSGEGKSWVTPTFTGGAYYDGAYNKVSYDEISNKKPKLNVQGGWVAMMEHYFVSSWYFSEKENNLFYTKEVNAGGDRRDYIIGARSEALIVQPNENAIFESSLYVGPKLQKELEQISEGLELTIDYGVLTFIAKPLFWLLDKIHLIVGNWGWAIILLTILIKLAFYKLSETSYRSMAKMKQFSPKIQSIRERYGSDRQKMNQAMMDMYKQEKINPLGGCWPILIQIPVFIALYWVLLESVELRQAEFIFWLNDLSAKDPYYVLPLIMGASMYFQQKLNPAPPDPMQAKIMQILPIVFTAFFAFFPSGLVLYWVVNNLLSIAQQWRITKIITSSK